MISQDTASRIWSCYREIETAETLLVDLERTAQAYPFDASAPSIKDAFGRKQHLQLGIPCGENTSRLYDVPPQLAKSVILAHIAAKRAELVEANEQARIELQSDATPNQPEDE